LFQLNKIKQKTHIFSFVSSFYPRPSLLCHQLLIIKRNEVKRLMTEAERERDHISFTYLVLWLLGRFPLSLHPSSHYLIGGSETKVM
jgi:hypothetical protein